VGVGANIVEERENSIQSDLKTDHHKVVAKL